MERIGFTVAERQAIIEKLRRYCAEELDAEMGNLAGEQMLDFLAEEIGGFFYNRGLYDAQAMLQKKLDDIAESILLLERPLGGR